MDQTSRYYHSGLPTTWGPSPKVYAIHSTQLNSFLYINWDQDIVRRVQFLLSSKIPTWVYKVHLPLVSPKTAFHNGTVERWTLQPKVNAPEISRYQVNHDRIETLYCNELNVLGDIAGDIQLRDQAANEDTLLLKDWAIFLAHMVMKIKESEGPADEILFRIMMSDAMHVKSDLPHDDLSFIISKIYKLLLLSTDIDDFNRQCKEEMLETQNLKEFEGIPLIYSRINKFNKITIWNELD